jgi:phage N-6-adenine-methyltransferase
MEELFNSAQFSSKNDDALRDFEIDVSSKKKALKRTQPKLDPAWDDGSAFPEVSSKNFLEEKQKDFVVGDTCGTRVRERSETTDNDACGNRSDDRIQPEAETTPKSKASDCWYTPPEIIALIQQCLGGITLDPCADDGKHVESCYHFTVADDGLSQQWFGRVFMNPPYSCPGVWIAKLQEEFNCGRVEEAIALVPVATDTKWFHPLIASNLICFWKGRIKFLDVNYQPKMAARQSHCLIYWGKNQSRFRQVFSSFGSFNLLEERGSNLYPLGSKVTVNNPQKYYSDWDWGIITGLTVKDGKIDVKMGDRFIIAVDITDLFLAEVGANSVCSISHNLTSAQGLAQDSSLQLQNLEDSSLSEPQRLTNTAVAFSQNGSPVSATTVTCEVSQCEISENSGEKSTLLQLRHHVSPFQSRESDKEKKTPATVSPPSNEPLNLSDPNSSALKTCQDCSIAHLDQGGQHSIFSTSYARLPDSAMMLNGCVSLQEPLEVPLLEKDCSWLESPGALSTGKGRPPGQTKQEAQLKKLKVLAPGEVINPEFLESAYSLPLGWTDPQDERSASELLAKTEQFAIAALPLETPLTGELLPLDFAASPTSTPCLEKSLCVGNQQDRIFRYVETCTLQLKAITLHQPWAYLVGRSKYFETRSWSTNYRGKIAIHAAKKQHDTDEWCSLLKDLLPPVASLVFGAVVALADLTDCTLMTEEFINQQSETELRCGLWKPGRYAWKLENVQILPEAILAKGKQGLWNIELLIPSIECTQQSNNVSCPSCQSPLLTLNDGCGMCGWIPANFLEDKKQSPPIESLSLSPVESNTTPEKFLEESTADTKQLPSQKRRQRKGCLYKYLENKKLKNGNIASYPRVIGETRDPDNPKHWRWGFNWEEKIDGEWKGRSIGSVPLGAIALIQSMQKSGVPLSEIISFIKRSKNKA